MNAVFNMNDSLGPLHELRREQDAVDLEIIQAIAKRIALRRKITAFRSAHDLPTIDPARMEVVLTQAEKYARENNVPPELGRELFTLLIDWSHRLDIEWRKESEK